MRLSELRDYLSQKIDTQNFREIISDEVATYKRGASEIGRSMPVILTEDIEFLMTKEACLRLCEDYIRGNLSEADINYISDALLLSKNVAFNSIKINEAIENLTDYELNGHLLTDTINNVIEQLNDE